MHAGCVDATHLRRGEEVVGCGDVRIWLPNLQIIPQALKPFVRGRALCHRFRGIDHSFHCFLF